MQSKNGPLRVHRMNSKLQNRKLTSQRMKNDEERMKNGEERSRKHFGSVQALIFLLLSPSSH